MADVHIRNLKKSYGSVVALQDISLNIPAGSFFTLLGPSGCGKTTLLRTIAGFHRQDQGSIHVGSESMEDKPVHLRDIGMVFQDYAVFPHLSVEQNIGFGLKQRKFARSEINSQVSEILEIVQLGHLATRMPHELSGGQQQRVGLARALVTRPKVMLMDEPLSNLDAQLRIDLRQELRTIQKNLGITTIYVTHDQEEALEMSDFVCVMHKGVIQHSDTPWSIYHEPANRFVASFVGSNNFLRMEVIEGSPCMGGFALKNLDRDSFVFDNNKVVAAIRPEDFRLCLSGEDKTVDESSIRIPVSLQYRSFAGRELRISAEVPDGTMVQIIAAPRPEFLALEKNTKLHVLIPRNKISFFQSDDVGVRLK
ncbi:MAG: ABC transporter ATP-binding protein [Granulosicoccus sp.]